MSKSNTELGYRHCVGANWEGTVPSGAGIPCETAVRLLDEVQAQSIGPLFPAKIAATSVG